MNIDTPEYLKELLAHERGPCISIYLPTLRAKPPAAENPRRLSNHLRQARDRLAGMYRHHVIAPVLEKLDQVARDDSLFLHPTDGMAIFISPELLRVLHLEKPVKDFVEVGDAFHLKPLIRAYQAAGRYQVLCLSQKRVALYEGVQDRLDDIELHNVPRSMAEAIGLYPPEVPEEVRINSISGGEDLPRYFRIVDQAIWEFYSHRSGLPLVLCAIEEYQGLFHRLSKNPNLAPQGIPINPDSISIQRLGQEAWKIIEPFHAQQLSRLIETYGLARSRQRGSEDLVQVAEAAAGARVGTLLLDANMRIGGKLDPSGRIELGDPALPQYNDLLDDIAEKVIKGGGQVLIMPPEQMPSSTGVAAIYRF